MNKIAVAAFAGILGLTGLTGLTSAEVTSEDIKRYFEDELGNRDVLKEYTLRAEMELNLFIICSRSSDLNEATVAREGGVALQQKRKALREQILELKNENRDSFTMLTVSTADIVDASYEAQRTCVAHAANLKYLEAEN